MAALVAALKDDFYVDGDMILDAIRRQSSFNVILLKTMDKADVFIHRSDPWERAQMARRQLAHPDLDQPAVAVYFASAEDVILSKLRWYRMGNEVSERQWNDVLGVLKVEGRSLDRAYLHEWATSLGVDDLLGRALAEVNLQDP